MAGHGIYVAFDATGRHYAYAVHPLTLKGRDDRPIAGVDPVEDQEREIRNMRRAAKRKGGEVRLLTSAEYERIVLNHYELGVGQSALPEK